MECYCTWIIEILRYFFILQSLTTSKMRNFQTLKLSQFHKAKTCWTENWWSSGIMSNFWGQFFYVLGGKKKLKKKFKNVLATALKSYIKWLLYFFFFEKVWKSWKNWNYLHKIFVTMYSICYTRCTTLFCCYDFEIEFGRINSTKSN